MNDFQIRSLRQTRPEEPDRVSTLVALCPTPTCSSPVASLLRLLSEIRNFQAVPPKAYTRRLRPNVGGDSCPSDASQRAALFWLPWNL